ncbi:MULTISPECIES: carotenoid biosynthesis protein [Geobacter]|mgnify:CR=1 FL=1|uniref:Membrane protein n=2 Tax=Geobacter TaxID=28231 RepID=A0A0C1TMD6_9BACT|nr:MULTISPECIES: carotenoid biosynthesis protein [Geobacter]KIE42059.1 membrane protein [Geobacter soli]MBE2886687.1 carotenoid biosynthesis protein [Geobacter anodireducens]HMN02171.1 carotenoid biosynthesis protein [Geobacter anodireducens]
MEDVLRIAVGTVTMRPYVFAFFAAYLVAAVPHLGWRKTLLFTAAGYLISFASEFSSINTGIPYGWYYYIDATRDRELWIAGVPFFDSLSYVFLAYCSYATALFVVSPVKAWRWDVVTLESRSIRGSFAVLFLGSLFQVFLDIIIDPVALQGYRWFLGQIYGYREPGIHFGVPLSNYVGWWVVSVIMVFVLQRIDLWSEGKGGKPAGVANPPLRSLYGPILYLSVLVFNLAVTLWLGEYLIALTGILIYVLAGSIAIVTIVRRTNRYRKEELAEHLSDYPWSAVSGRSAKE